jgi:hypothetical protein
LQRVGGGDHGWPVLSSGSMMLSQLADSANARGRERWSVSWESPSREGRLPGQVRAEPVLEAVRGDACAAARGERVVVELCDCRARLPAVAGVGSFSWTGRRWRPCSIRMW